MARLKVKVHPRAKVTRVVGRCGDFYRLDLAAPPVDGKANQACIEYLARLTGVPKSCVRIVTGATSRIKIVEIGGIGQEKLEDRLLR